MKATQQLSLFDHASPEMLSGGGYIAVMKAAMRRAAAESGLSRAQIVDKMNALAGGRALTQGSKKGIGPDTFDKWLADEERAQMPSGFALDVFMRAAGSLAPLEAWLGLYGCTVLTPKGKKTLEYAELVLEEGSHGRNREGAGR
ncbi:MAG: hypothetical protein LBC94_03855 [Desulfovibrio sp.]|jgi:hypothetical protein|nr:hypothetical protein [Desulfovibrio sp.]